MDQIYELNRERQIDELSTLESICGENEFTYSLKELVPVGYADISIVTSPITVLYCEPKTTQVSTIVLSYLPPIRLHFEMPREYPNSQPPQFTISCKWLSAKQMTEICTELDKIWNSDKGEEVLYKWIQFIKYECIEFLHIKELNLVPKEMHKTNQTLSNEFKNPSKNCDEKENEINNENVPKECQIHRDTGKISENIEREKDVRVLWERTSDMLITALKEHNEKCLQDEFNLSYVYCEICCIESAGLHCIKLSCNHSFCKACVSEYLLTKIKDGNVINIACPESDCDQEINAMQIKKMVSPDIFLTYENLLLNQTLDTMMDIIYCPRIVCQYPVTYNPAETVASCPNCLYSFCVLCKRVYHGVEPCKLKKEDRLEVINKYQTGTDEYRKEINKRYGESYIKRLLEDHASEETISNSTKPCPKCSVQIEKSEGCNKMACNRCQTFFCYLCLSVLSKSDPYDHFANPASPCYNQLFPHERNEEDDDINIQMREMLFF